LAHGSSAGTTETATIIFAVGAWSTPGRRGFSPSLDRDGGRGTVWRFHCFPGNERASVAAEQDPTRERAVKLNHVNLPVVDVSATRDFFERHFGFQCVAEPADAIVVLTDNAGLVLTISNFDHADRVTYPKGFHVGFMQDSDDKVDAIYNRLKTAGIEPGRPHDMHGAHTFYFIAPGGFTVEVFHQRGLVHSEGR
jgi:lactoylglutathione lyase